MDELQSLQRQLEEARDEAELNLLQLQQVQEELEFYFLRCQDLERELADQDTQGTAATVAEPEAAPSPDVGAELTNLQDILASTKAKLAELEQQRSAEQQLLATAQSMLEGQARYLEDVSHREEQAAQALDRLRLLEAEIGYYICHSKPLASLDPQRINRLIQLAKQPGLNRQAV